MCALAAASTGVPAAAQVRDAPVAPAAPSLPDLSLEELGSLPVTSVSGRAERWQDAPASVYVITGDDIRRSGAVTLPQALRLAPNLHVAALNATQNAISARGFNTAIANKLLVLIDGRTVYSPLFSGVLWDAQDVVLEDVDRIEVISGPGGTLWGANAVNGVINVVTRTAAATQGTQLSVGGGEHGHHTSLRHGLRLGDQAHLRLYALTRHTDNTLRADGTPVTDQASKRQLGFRTDWADERRSLTVQGEAYEGGEAPGTNTAPVQRGHHLLARLGERRADGAEWTLQGYVDSAERDEPVIFRDRTRTVDLRFDHALPARGAHRLLWGLNAREAFSRTERTTAEFLPGDRRLHWASVYLQDEVRLAPRWQVTGGLKLERNRYNGWEWMPSLRLAWRPSDARMVWAGLSRAVRAPSRIDREFFFPAVTRSLIAGGPDFQSEIALVAEVGVRGQVGADWSYSATAYRQQYEGLRAGGTTLPTQVENRIDGHADGVEAWGSWQAGRSWRLSAGLLAQKKALRARPGTAPSSIANLGNDPTSQWSLHSSHQLGPAQALDLFLRRVGALPQPAIPAYTALDVRWGWRPTPQAEVSLALFNALDPHHPEFEANPSLQRRRLWLRLVLSDHR
ncbi:TonB-dependent siderophore receptor [Aquabacterium sp. J223]|uniref:TonB-dependent receptor plug domain-containing protein n=1 Tax=Aquabacterium sp. J223 TaxID=2898431 RepID=UPI0021AE1747|nr:TonB-dependent receptor [Aquabacterium sp. J223]UUX94441.1 TonB-dependent receptor [Aquabacterium sp. J223]